MRAAARLLFPVIAVLALSAAPARAAGACAGAEMRPTPENLREVRAATLCLLNVHRARHGLPKLRANVRLRHAAERHSRAMNARNFFAHSSPTGSTMLARVRATGYTEGANSWSVGENIAWGESYLAKPREIVQAWMRSPGHRANILYRRFRHIGIGVVLGTPVPGASGATYTTNFGFRG